MMRLVTKVSAKNKSRLKMLVFLHWLLGGFHLLRLLPELVSVVGVSLLLPAALANTPTPHQIDWAWLVSLPFTLVAMSATR